MSDLIKYIEQMEDTFSTEGFKRLEDELKAGVESLKEEIVNSSDSNYIHQLRGQIIGYRRVLAYRALIEQLRKEPEDVEI